MPSEPESDSDQDIKYIISSALQDANDLRAEAKRDHVLEALLRGDPSGLPGATPPLDDSENKETGVRPGRRVFREWPRDPSGIVFDPSICGGKSAPNGTGLWGATLYDFYHVTVNPAAADDTRKNRVISTGSQLSNWAEKVDETELVKEEMTWANQEEGPKIRLAADIISNISDLDWWLSFGVSAKKKQDRKDSQVPTDPPCWPLVPFSYDKPMLQSPVPLHLLPQRLIVHDPWGLVHGKTDGFPDSCNWSDVPDITYTYKLCPSKKGQEIISESRQAAETLAKTPSSPHVLLTITGKAKDPAHVPPPILVSVPSPPCPPTQAPCPAHLYLTPEKYWSEGYHSLAYDAEWEVPRSILSVSNESQAHVAKICHQCVTEAAHKILDEKETKRQAILHAYHARKRSRAARASPDSDSDEDIIIVGPLRTKLESVEQVTPAASIDISRCTTFVDQPSAPSSSKTKLPDENRRVYTVKPATTTIVETWEGYVTEIHVDSVPWFLPGEKAPNCPHSRRMGPVHLSHPLPTAPVRVMAKTSRTGGPHLSQEASNYESLPRSMSEHWTGFNVVPPLENPTPLGAIIPNYFGYYVRVREDGSLEDEKCVPPKHEDDDAMDVDSEAKEVPREEYFSPILLMENCGLRIDLFQEELDASRDEREECAALLLRLHHLGWVLGACHVGKFSAHYGDHADWPIFKSQNDRRYRITGLSNLWSREDALANGKLEEWEQRRQQEVAVCAKMLNVEFPVRP